MSTASLKFLSTGAGWVTFSVHPFDALGVIYATHLDDPFPSFIEWLEQIVQGVPVARWSINEEGCCVELIYVREPGRGVMAIGCGHLVGLRSWGLGHQVEVAAVAIDPRTLAKDFYLAFRSFVGSECYVPSEWEYDGMGDESTWSGDALKELRSTLIEAELERHPLCSDHQDLGSDSPPPRGGRSSAARVGVTGA